MWDFKRYAIYYAPEPGPLADFGASWLGWDAVHGDTMAHPDIDGLDVAALSATPRKYGFHGTIKPPFRLAEGETAQDLHAATELLCRSLAPVTLDGLELSQLGGFLALTPTGDASALAQLAGAMVTGLDRFRAPLTEAEIAKRNPDRLSDTQRDLLERWGYPYVLQEFRFHLTLTGRLGDQAGPVRDAIAPLVTPLLPRPFVVRDLCLFGEDQDGRFHQLHRYALSG